MSAERVSIDLDDDEQVGRLVRHYYGSNNSIVFDRMRAALRNFANPNPEPTGLGAVVEDVDGVLWVRAGMDEDDLMPWRNEDKGWAGHIDVARVLSEGWTA